MSCSSLLSAAGIAASEIILERSIAMGFAVIEFSPITGNTLCMIPPAPFKDGHFLERRKVPGLRDFFEDL
jgi:hypothetical protein